MNKARQSEEAARKRRREREQRDRENLADWYVKKLATARYGDLLTEHCPEVLQIVRLIVLIRRTCSEQLGQRGRLSPSTMRPEVLEKYLDKRPRQRAPDAAQTRSMKRRDARSHRSG